jgi:hypothetical protein
MGCEYGQKGGVLLLTRRDGGGARAFDDLATGLESGAITRGKAMKLAGAALVASALGLSYASEAQAFRGPLNKKQCEAKEGVFCRSKETGLKICCRPRKEACCGKFGAQCCAKGKCNKGKCVGT